MHNISSQLFDNIPDNSQAFKAIGDETRLRMLGLLISGELCVCDFITILELPQSTASRHLAYLKNSGWIVGRRNGKWMNYRLHPKMEKNSIHYQIITFLSILPEVQKDLTRLSTYMLNKQGGC